MVAAIQFQNGLHLMLWCEMRVSQRHSETGVPEQFSNRVQVDAPHGELTRESGLRIVAAAA